MREIVMPVFVVFMAAVISGCATTSKGSQLEMQVSELQNAVNSLSSKVDSLSTMEMRLEETERAMAEVKGDMDDMKDSGRYASREDSSSGAKKGSPTTKQIQLALRNAGFNPGPADGKKGAKTRSAIRAFKKSHGLKNNDKVDKATWNLLRKYLYEK